MRSLRLRAVGRSDERQRVDDLVMERVRLRNSRDIVVGDDRMRNGLRGWCMDSE